MRRLASLAGVALLTALLAACGSSSWWGGPGSRGPSGSPHEPVSVLYAGSLVNLMEHDLGPAFSKATGDSFQGFGAGSTELVAQIKSKVRQGDVFISASPKATQMLEGPANDSWITWYVTFAKAPLVLGYNPQSHFASQFRSEAWYRVITQSGIRVGRTDPKLDPKGKLTVEALDEAAAKLHMPSLTAAVSGFPVFPEESLVGRLQAGQLDAGFFYANEATEQHISAVPLTGISKSATYTVSILKSAPDPAGAQRFVAFLLGSRGRAILARHGLSVLKAHLVGRASAVPPALRSIASG